MDRDACERMDRDCPLGALRERFSLPDGVLYFDGNSLGALPRTTAADIDRAVREEWGRCLVESWLDADWFFLARKAGDAIAPLIGASEGEVVVADSTSVNLFKLAAALLRRSEGRRAVVTERGNFPTDVYILEGRADLFGGRFDLVLAAPEAIAGSIDEGTALVLLTHVNFRTGTMHDMERLTAHCRARGVPVIWDLSHSAGAVPLALNPWLDQERIERKTARQRADLIELLVSDSIERGKLVEVSLRSGKSYIGFALRSRVTSHPDTQISILPMSSGYRDKDTQELRITTHYAPVVWRNIENLQDSEAAEFDPINDLRVVIPRSEIVSARLFDPDLHDRFQEAANPPSAEESAPTGSG